MFYKFTCDEMWALDLTMWNSLHNARLRRGSMLYNPQERLLTRQATIYVMLSVTLYFAGTAMLNKVDSKHTAST